MEVVEFVQNKWEENGQIEKIGSGWRWFKWNWILRTVQGPFYLFWGLPQPSCSLSVNNLSTSYWVFPTSHQISFFFKKHLKHVWDCPMSVLNIFSLLSDLVGWSRATPLRLSDIWGLVCPSTPECRDCVHCRYRTEVSFLVLLDTACTLP